MRPTGRGSESSPPLTSMIWRSSPSGCSSRMRNSAAVCRRGFDHILMDELQDTNPLQWKLMGLIRQSDAFFAVGDVNHRSSDSGTPNLSCTGGIALSRKRRKGD